jgi:hypothetical protein
MSDESGYEAWGRAVVEEVLLRAGLALSSAAGGESAGAPLAFRVTANPDRSLTLEFDRVAAAPERIRIGLDR